MKTMLKTGLLLAMALAALPAQAAEWPDKPIRVILSVPAGATPDVTARLVFPGLMQQLGVSLVADNRAGGGGVIGAEIAAKSAPDGYTLFISSPGALTILPHMRKNIPYDTIRDFAPVSLISIGPFVLMTHPSVPAKTMLILGRHYPNTASKELPSELIARTHLTADNPSLRVEQLPSGRQLTLRSTQLKLVIASGVEV